MMHFYRIPCSAVLVAMEMMQTAIDAEWADVAQCTGTDSFETLGNHRKNNQGLWLLDWQVPLPTGSANQVLLLQYRMQTPSLKALLLCSIEKASVRWTLLGCCSQHAHT
jgi:hypothetical protein